jgi:hypothetical protein
MAYTVTELITRSFYLSGKTAKGLQTVSGEDLNDGLQMLNALLSFKTADQRLIPYFSIYNFTAVIGQEEYFIPNLVMPQTLTFTISTTRYSMISESRDKYFGTPRANDVQSLPYQYFIERCFQGSNLYMYFLPNETYPFQLTGKFSLEDVSLNQDLSTTYDQFYIEYLRYALAEYICQEFNITFQPQSAQKLKEFEQVLIDIGPIDLSMSKMSSLQKANFINYGDINIGRGWRP